MRSLRRICGKTLWDMERNDDIRKECGIEVSVVLKMNKMKSFGHVGRKDADRNLKAERKSIRRRDPLKMMWIEHIDSDLKEGQV
jgi:hypothetical protein